MLADGLALTDIRVSMQPVRKTREPTVTAQPRPEPTTPDNGGADHRKTWFGTL
jgi:hypothetical protein